MSAAARFAYGGVSGDDGGGPHGGGMMRRTTCKQFRALLELYESVFDPEIIKAYAENEQEAAMIAFIVLHIGDICPLDQMASSAPDDCVESILAYLRRIPRHLKPFTH